MSCERCHSPLEPGDLRCSICGLPTPPSPDDDAVAEAVASILRCHGCGAAVAYDAKAGAPKCGFCGAVMEVETPEDPIESAEAFLAFRVDAAQATAALSDWLGRQGWFRPRDLRERARIDGLKPLWFAGWVFDAGVEVAWAADSDAGARRSSWAPHAGELEVELANVLVSASRGLSEAECRDLAEGYNIGDATPAADGPTGAIVEQFAVQRSAARRTIAAALSRVAAAHARARVPGSSVRNLNVAVVPRRMATRRLGFPAWVMAYRYGDAVYRAIVHGQNAGIVIGKTPIAWGRIAALLVGVVAVVITATWLLARR